MRQQLGLTLWAIYLDGRFRQRALSRPTLKTCILDPASPGCSVNLGGVNPVDGGYTPEETKATGIVWPTLERTRVPSASVLLSSLRTPCDI